MRRNQFVFNVSVFALAFLSFHTMLGQDTPAAIQSGGGSNAAAPLNGGTGLPAQVPQPAPAAVEGRIHLDVVVTDKSGKPVSGLDLKDFTLLDNNQPAKILSFHAVGGTVQKAEPPVEVILVLDTVNLPFQAVSIVRQQIVNFLLQNGGHLAQPVSLFVLTNQGLDVQRRPTLDGTALAAEASQLDNKLRTLPRSAGFWGAIERYQLSVQSMLLIAQDEEKKPGRKLLIWAGPGWPQFDNTRLKSTYKDQLQDFDLIVQLSTRLRETRISAYSISLGQPNFETLLYKDHLNGVKTAGQAYLPNLGLKVLAVQSGGAVFGPDNDLTAQINRCVRDAQVFYTISFDPPHAAQANEYHKLEVRIDKPGLEVRTRAGYYNQP
jgi:VWFA-related protein